MSKLKGYIVLVVAVVMQTCLGGVYAWSVFCGPLKAQFRFCDWQTQLVFGTTILTFTVSLVFTGRLQDRFGPRPLAVASGALLSAGYLTSWLGGSNYLLLLLGNGVICGLAIGAGYVCPIATAVKWFPKRRGLVSGLAVAGYGAAAIILTMVANSLMRLGWRPLDVLGLVGAIYGPVVILCGLLLFLPGPIEHHHMRSFRRRELLGDQRFWWMAIALFTASFPGLIFIGNLKNIGAELGNPETVVLIAITAMAIGNAIGRIAWGFVYDWFGGRRAAIMSLGSIILSAILAASAGDNGSLFIAASFVVGFCYGGSFGIYAPETAKLYGAAVLGTVYPFIMISHGITAVAGPSISGWIYDNWGSYLPGLIGGGAVTLVGLIVCGLWSNPIKRAEAQAHCQPARSATQISAEASAP